MGPAVCGALAEGPDADAGRTPHRTDSGDATRGSDFTVARQRLPALRLRLVDGPGVSGLPLRAIRGRRGDPLCDREAGAGGAGRGRPPVRRYRPDPAPG